MTRSFSVLSALARAFAFVPKAWMFAWGALALLAAVLAAPFFLVHHDPRFMTVFLILWPLASLLAGLVAGGALFRLGVGASVKEARRLGLGLGGLQLGRPEVRLFGAGVIVALFLATVALGFAVLGAFIYRASGLGSFALSDLCRGARNGDGGSILMAAYLALSAWMLVQLAVRLSLYKPATVARGRMVSLDSMSLAQGSLWRLLAGLIVVLAPAYLIAAAHHGLVRAAAPPIANLSPARVWAVIEAVGLAFVQAPLAAGFLSEAYKKLEYWTGQAGGGDHG